MDKSTQNESSFYRVITRKIVLSIVLVSFTPLFLISWAMLEQFNFSYKEKVHAHLGELVEKHRQHIDGFLNGQLNILQFFADSHTFEQLREESFLEASLSRLQLQFGGVFEDLGVIDDHGVQVAYSGPFKLLKAHYADADWFQKAVERQFFISDVFLGLRGLPHFIVAVRRDYQGRHWIVRATIDFMAFNDLVKNLRIGETGVACILNKSEAYQTSPPVGSVPGENHFSKFIDQTGRDKSRVRIFEIAGAAGPKSIHVGAFLKNGEWLLIYRQDTADAYRDLNHARHVALMIILTGGIIITTTAVILSRRMVARLAGADQEKRLMNRQIIETGKLAAIGELAAGIAHEINNPVAIMMEEAGWIQDLLEEEDFKAGENLDEFQRALSQIKNQGRRCKEITHKLLSFARKTDSRPHKLQVNELLEEAIGLSEQRAKYAGVEIQKNFDPGLPSIKASPTELQQVFLNLFNNAMDAMENNGGRLIVNSRRIDSTVEIQVGDTGPGMPAANLKKIFDPFFTTKPVGKGTGLGLSICYGIVKKIGGHITVESEIGHGTMFTIQLPIEKDGQAHAQPPGENSPIAHALKKEPI